jgi:hypothetical protein
MTGRLWRRAVLGLAALAAFSALFSWAARRGVWPQLSPGALHNWDQWIGLAGGLLIFLLLLRPRLNDWRRRTGDSTRIGHDDEVS